MSNLQRNGESGFRGPRVQTGRRMGLTTGLLIILALLVTACGSAAEPAAVPTAVPTSPPAPTDTPVAETMITPSVTVADQEIADGKVVVAEVVSDGPGWLVIHAQADSKPGPILGYSPVTDGANVDVLVEIDLARATETLYAMLHTDAGEVGTWEFPGGPDAPVKVGEQVVTLAFVVTDGLAVAEEPIVPSVTVADQEIAADKVIIAEVVSDGPGWLVIHAQADGKPGPILGYSPVGDGANADVLVEIDAANATETLYAMLHTDAGEVGTWEFPDGPDAPVKVGEQVVTPAFAITGGLAMVEEILPSVTVADQEIVEDRVMIAEVVSDGPGWLVVHAQADGKPGPILGYSAVGSGTNAGVRVSIDTSSATETLYAMLHTDAGEIGTWEFPNGPDAPVMVGEQVVTPAFKVSNQAAVVQSEPAAIPTAPSNAGGEIPAGAVVVTGDEAEVEIEDFKFNPQVLVIRLGTTVKFANKDEVQHTATSDTGVFDSGYLSKGEEYFFTFTEPGTYPYYCIPHGGPGGQGMAATIIVQP
jgi:plastocyanin